MLLDFNLGVSRANELKKKYHIHLGRNAFYGLFRNPAYCGHNFIEAFKGNTDEYVKANWYAERMISFEQFEYNQTLMNSRVKKKNTLPYSTDKFFLKGVLKCKNTDLKMTTSNSRGRNVKNLLIIIHNTILLVVSAYLQF